MGCPAILPDNGSNCWTKFTVAAGDAPYLRDTEKALDSAIQQVAAANGATYVDTYTPSIGHDACQSSAQAWMSGLNGTASFHPDAAGAAQMAVELEGVL